MVDEEKLLCGLEINPTEAELWEAWENSVVNGYGDFPDDDEALELFDCGHEDDCDCEEDCDCIDYIWENMREKFTFAEAYKRAYDYCFEKNWDQDFYSVMDYRVSRKVHSPCETRDYETYDCLS